MNYYKKPQELYIIEVKNDLHIHDFILYNEHTPSCVISKIIKHINYYSLAYTASEHKNISPDDLDTIYTRYSASIVICTNIALNKNTSVETLIKLSTHHSNYVVSKVRENPNLPLECI